MTDITATDVVTGDATKIKGGPGGGLLKLTDTPVLLTDLPPDVVKLAKKNAAESFPWGGDYSTAKTVTCVPASPEASSGIFQLRRDNYPTAKFPDGSTGIVVQGDINHPVSFYVHPSFAKITTKEYYVRATVRRLGGGNVGMNLIYELADGQGRTPYKNREQWFGATKEDGWQTHTWHLTDACFSKMWGYDFTLRPEQSVPFVIGKVEVSTEPFK
jgi:hypothetical protein